MRIQAFHCLRGNRKAPFEVLGAPVFIKDEEKDDKKDMTQMN